VPKADDYRERRAGAWHLTILPERWSDELERKVLALVAAQPAEKHPRTIEIEGVHPGEKLFLKIFHRAPRAGGFKDVFRASKGRRFWRQGLALSAAGFHAPLALSAGELRRLRWVQRSFVVTGKIEGKPLPEFLQDLLRQTDRIGIKRKSIAALAQTVRRLHSCGFVHGDLVASNLFVATDRRGDGVFWFMDNDRTQRFPSWLPQSRWKRNLVQLNRLPLPGITLQDRMRFFRAYLGRSRLTESDRQFARWIESKTRRRRHECDGVDPNLSFRRLMRWKAQPGRPS